jgi:protein-tyrosine phosphatase
LNILFICSRNRWRSLTAETIFKRHQHHTIRSAGTSKEARIKVSEKLILWADLIFVMEKKHKGILEQKFSQSISEKEIVILNIEDLYQYMDEELIEILKKSTEHYLD